MLTVTVILTTFFHNHVVAQNKKKGKKEKNITNKQSNKQEYEHKTRIRKQS